MKQYTLVDGVLTPGVDVVKSAPHKAVFWGMIAFDPFIGHIPESGILLLSICQSVKKGTINLWLKSNETGIHVVIQRAGIEEAFALVPLQTQGHLIVKTCIESDKHVEFTITEANGLNTSKILSSLVTMPSPDTEYELTWMPERKDLKKSTKNKGQNADEIVFMAEFS